VERDVSAEPWTGSLPAELTSFAGRRAELHSIRTTLSAARLVTLTGPGGCGKSRLAGRAARQQGGQWRDGAWWVDLSYETDPAGLPGRLAAVVGALLVSEVDATPSLVRQLADRHLLVVLDNCEHLLPAAGDLVGALLRGCPHATVLATSREPLGMPGEVVWRVPPLDSHDAVTLFTDRGESLPATDEAAAAVRRICERLDRMPLALELAAAWTGTLSPQEIVAELDDRFGMLVTGPRSVPPRHRTLEASMAWSHGLLLEPDRILFRRLSVFQAGFTRQAAQSVCAFAGLDNAAILAGLRRLIDKSMLIAETREGVARYRMLETVRHYAAERLADAGEHAAVQRRHLTTYLALAEAAAPLLDTDKDAWRATIHVDYANIRAAIECGLSLDDTDAGRRLAASLAWLWHLEGRRAEGLGLLGLAAEQGNGEHSALQACVLTGLALVADTTHPTGYEFDAAEAARDMALAHGDRRTARLAGQLVTIGLLGRDLDAVYTESARSHEEATEAGDGLVADGAHVLMGLVCHLRDEHRKALSLLAPATVGLTRRGDRGIASMALWLMALSTAYGGDLRRARELAEEAVSMAVPLADYHRVGSARSVLAVVCALQGEVEQARDALDPVVRLVDQAGSLPFIPGLARTVGQLHMREGRPDLAIRWYRSEASWRGEAGSDDRLAPETRIALAAALRATGDVAAADRVCTAALATARALRMPRLIADALEQKAFLTNGADADRATALHHEALGLRIAHGLRLACVDSLDVLAASGARRGSPLTAARLLGAGDRAREETGYPRAQPDLALRAELAEFLGTAAGEDAMAEGRRMSLDEAVAFARRARASRRRPVQGWASLTSTEQEVVRLAVAGLTNPEIGKRLFMSRSTVKTHLAHVYAKLGVANRTELATSAAGENVDG